MDGMKVWREAQTLQKKKPHWPFFFYLHPSCEQRQHTHTCLMNGSFCPVYSAVKTPWSDSFCIQKEKALKKNTAKHVNVQMGALCVFFSREIQMKMLKMSAAKVSIDYF